MEGDGCLRRSPWQAMCAVLLAFAFAVGLVAYVLQVMLSDWDPDFPFPLVFLTFVCYLTALVDVSCFTLSVIETNSVRRRQLLIVSVALFVLAFLILVVCWALSLIDGVVLKNSLEIRSGPHARFVDAFLTLFVFCTSLVAFAALCLIVFASVTCGSEHSPPPPPPRPPSPTQIDAPSQTHIDA